jgi:hypothetical protein
MGDSREPVAGSAAARAEVFHCSAQGKDGAFTTTVEVDIVIPHPMETDKSLWVLEHGSRRPVNMASPSVAVGSIEIVRTDTLGEAKRTADRRRFDLVINQLPSTISSLVAFFFEDRISGHPALLKADLFDDSKRFTLARSMAGLGLEILTGNCK